ncbi:MAG: T9SS type A sorting domain-containing protein [Bacteroidia bacterium]|nr:T9SS type A sorting domain-containing protein [Bacteroidia bacterium]
MKKSLLFILLLVFTLSLQAQKDTMNVIATLPQKNISRDASNINISIYPVPVRENSFTIKTDRDISLIKITNIIGQDIFRIQYNNPQQLIRIPLDNPKRGMYLVTIIFSDGTRVVKKIMVEESE